MADTHVPAWADATFDPWLPRAAAGRAAPHLRAIPATWDKPLRWHSVAAQFRASYGRRRRVLCAPQTDPFSLATDPAWRADLFALIEATPELDWILSTRHVWDVRDMVLQACRILTERTGYVSPWAQGCWPENVWLGVPVADQADALRDIPALLAEPAAVRFLRMEPLRGDVDFYACASAWARRGRSPWFRGRILKGIDWVIAGGDAAAGRPAADLAWIRSAQAQCGAARVPFFFAGCGAEAAGRLLDGRTWDGFPGGGR